MIGTVSSRVVRFLVLIAVTLAYGLPWWQGEGVRTRTVQEGRAVIAQGMPAPAGAAALRPRDAGPHGVAWLAGATPVVIHPPTAVVIGRYAVEGSTHPEAPVATARSPRAPPRA